MGYGTERIEEDLQKYFPQARVARMDLDTTRSRTAYERLLADFERGQIDILVGTQMVTKGLDFDRVSVVGILNADALLNQPDFRSYERAFQLMSQVAGRAGRRRQQGLVIMQTRSPELPLISQVVANDYPAFYLSQVEERQAFRYPPFSRLVYVHLRHRDHPTVARLAADMATLLRQQFGTRVLGPDTPAVSRVAQLWRRQLILKIETTASMADARRRLRQIRARLLSQPQYRSAQLFFDVDPM
jgi:primosomal protein N' (replication factor Y)